MDRDPRLNTIAGRPWVPRLRLWRGGSLASLVAVMPLLTILVMAALMSVIVWLADRRDRTERAEALIRDALWVEQALRFQINAVEENAQQIAVALASATDVEADIGDRLRALVAAHPEIWAAKVTDSTGRKVERVPASAVDMWLDDPQMDLLTKARALDLPRFGTPRRVGPSVVVDMMIALSANARIGPLTNGGLLVSFDLGRMVSHHVPWWITQQNAVALQDHDGTVLAAKSALAIDQKSETHAISLDPPFPGLSIVVTRRSDGSSLATYAQLGAVLGLSGVAVLSVFALQRHWRRRLAAEMDLKEAHAFRKAMEESLTIGMRARDLSGRIIYVNPAFCRMVGLEAEALVGRSPPMPYWVPDLIDATLARHEALGANRLESKSFETRFRHLPDGRVFDVLVYEAPLVDAQGLHRGWMGSIIDITDRKAADAKERLQAETLQRASRLTAMGEMASTIAHELNQPLAAITSYAAGALARAEADRLPPEDLKAALAKLDEQARRAGRVIRRVHDFVRKRDPVFAPVDVPALIDDLVAFLAPNAQRGQVTITQTVAPGLPKLRADRILIEQVVLNLARNAIEAMSGVAVGRRRLDLSVTATDREMTIAVSDHGPGIAQEVADRLFQPFVSTKTEGMGMGLNICRTIVELHQGRLDFRARDGGGTVFSVVLPLEEEEAVA